MENDYKYAIEINNANVFLNEKEILHNINWQVEKGEKFFILGANGAGKTTLVQTVLGYLWPHWGGEVKILGQKFGESNLNILRKSIAWVSPFIQQRLSKDSTGLSMTLSGPDGFLGYFGTPDKQILNEAYKLLERIDGLHLAQKSILEMSSGEQMKILIARALLTKPQLMILDEPNVYLDIKEREKFLKIIQDVIKNNPELTVVFISQRIEDILPEFKNGMILKKGKIEAIGNRENILTSENLKKIFDIKIKLIKSENGRLWSIVEE